MAALEAVGLDTGLRYRYPHELSGGQRQRVALARALVSEPELIVADEPVSSLDASAQARINDLIRELRESRGLAFLFVSHDLSVVQRLADSLSVMYLGELVETIAPATELFARPAHPYTRALLASVPVPDPGHPPPVALIGEPPSALTPPAGCVFHMRCPERIGALCHPRTGGNLSSRRGDAAPGKLSLMEQLKESRIWLPLALAATFACAACGPNVIEGRPPFIGISGMHLQGDTLAADFRIDNQNGVAMSIQAIEITVTVSEVTLSLQELDAAVKADAGGVRRGPEKSSRSCSRTGASRAFSWTSWTADASPSAWCTTIRR